MEPWRTLVEAYAAEDRLLRELVASCPRELRDKAGDKGALSCKAVLAHLAYWDGFTVDFFRSKLDPTRFPAPPPLDFEDKDKKAQASWAALPFGEILARYLEASANLRDFLEEYWDRLSPKERHEFGVPLRHHQDHRLALELSLAPDLEATQLDSMAPGA